MCDVLDKVENRASEDETYRDKLMKELGIN